MYVRVKRQRINTVDNQREKKTENATLSYATNRTTLVYLRFSLLMLVDFHTNSSVSGSGLHGNLVLHPFYEMSRFLTGSSPYIS